MKQAYHYKHVALEGIGRPIAAGNLFLGTFDSSNLLKEALTLTHLCGLLPQRARNAYRVPLPSWLQNGHNGTAGEKDMFDLYAVLFEVGDGVTYLDGIMYSTSDRVKAAQITDPKQQRTEFRLPLPPQNGKR